jgi:PAS domain S-box-containing protein
MVSDMKIELLQAVYETASDAILVIDREGAILSANPATSRIFGSDPDGWIGRSALELVPESRLEEYAPLLDEAVQGAREGREGTVLRLSGVRSDGSVFPCSLALARIEAEGREVFVAIVRDISRVTAVEEALIERSQELQRSNQQLENFAFLVSHDLQAPLRAVLHHAETLRRRAGAGLDPDARGSLEAVIDRSLRMKALIDGLLMLSRTAKETQAHSDFPLERAVDEALKNLELPVQEAGAKITRGVLPAVRACEEHLVQLFQNLIANAIKFQKGRAPEVHVSAREEEGKWVVCVEDNGIGIAPEHLDKIFAIFSRLHSRSEYPGSGIGLSLCRRIVESHGGRIWAESTPGEGSKFYFTVGAA